MDTIADFSVPGHLDQVPHLRRTVDELLRDRLGVDHPATAVKQILSELLANALLHTRSGDDGGRVHVRAGLIGRPTPDTVRIEVTDEGSDMTPYADDPDLVSEHGRGLVIVREFADAWGTRRGPNCTTVWADIRTPHRASLDI